MIQLFCWILISDSKKYKKRKKDDEDDYYDDDTNDGMEGGKRFLYICE